MLDELADLMDSDLEDVVSCVLITALELAARAAQAFLWWVPDA
jgi:hypothetical protein